MRSVLFRGAARLTIFSLLLQSILPSFAWAASADVLPPSLASSTHLDNPHHWLVLPRIHQELEMEEKAAAQSKPQQVYAINTLSKDTIRASLEFLQKLDIYKGLNQITGGWQWSAYGLSFTYLTPDKLQIGASAKTSLQISNPTEAPTGPTEAATGQNLTIDNPEVVGLIRLGQNLKLGNLTALNIDVENVGVNTNINKLKAKSFTQKAGTSLSIKSIHCKTLSNEGSLVSQTQLNLEISDSAINKGSIVAATLSGQIHQLHNHGALGGELKNLEFKGAVDDSPHATIESTFSGLAVGSLHNAKDARIKGSGHLRVGQGLNQGGINGTTLKLELFEQKGLFTNENLIKVTERLEVLGQGTLREGKESSLQTPHLFINNRDYENNSQKETVRDKVSVGKKVRSWINHKDAFFKANSLDFIGSSKALADSFQNHGRFTVDTFNNRAAYFKNKGNMHLITWQQSGKGFHNAEATIEVAGDAAFDVQTLRNDSDIIVKGHATFTTKELLNHGNFTVKGDLLGQIDDLTTTGGLVVERDLKLTGTTFINEKLVRIHRLGQWNGQTLRNSGRMTMGFCDIASHYQFLNSGIFLWRDYTLRAAHILNLGWMEQTQDLMQELKLNYGVAKAKLARDIGYKHFEIENQGVIKLQTAYKPKQAPHQRTNVQFQHWDNSGSFFDRARHLEAKSFTNTGTYESDGALTGRVDRFASTETLVAEAVRLTGESLTLGGKVMSKKELSFNGNQITTAEGLKAKAQNLKFQARTPMVLKGALNIANDATFRGPELVVQGRLKVGCDISGYVTDVTTQGKLFIKRNFKLKSQNLTNEAKGILHSGGVVEWSGQKLLNRGIMGMRYCDIAAHHQFINAGTFLWTHYTLRADHVLNLGWMEQTQTVFQTQQAEFKEAKDQSTAYKHFRVENRGTLKLQTNYTPERAAHQHTGVHFQHWDNSGTFLDKSRVLEAKSFRNTGGYQNEGRLTGHVDEFTSTDKLDVGSLSLTSKKVNISGIFESKGKVSFQMTEFTDDASLKLTVEALDLTTRQDLTLAGVYNVSKLDLAAPQLTVRGKLLQESKTEGSRYQGHSLKIEPKATFSVESLSVRSGTSVDNKGTFAAYWTYGTHLGSVFHTSQDPMLINGFVTLDYLFNISAIRLGRFASLKIKKGYAGVIEAQGPLKLLVRGGENKENDYLSAQVICLSDNIPVIRTQHKATVHFCPDSNVETFIRQHLSAQEYDDATPMVLKGSFFQSTGNLEYRKPLDINVDRFLNKHHLKLGPTTIRTSNFENGSPQQMGLLDFLGQTTITSINDLNNTHGRIIVNPVKNEGKVRIPGELALVSEQGSINVGVSSHDNGSLIAAKGKLALKSLRANINFNYAELETHSWLELFAPNGTFSTTTASLRAVGSIYVTAYQLDHCGGRLPVTEISGYRTERQVDVRAHEEVYYEKRDRFFGMGHSNIRKTRWIPETYKDVQVPNYITRPNSKGSELLSQNSIVFTLIYSGVCRGSKILAAQDIIAQGVDGRPVVEVQKVPNYNEQSEYKGYKIDINAQRFNLEGGYMGARIVRIEALAIGLFGGSGATGGAGQRQTYGLRAFFLGHQRGSNFYEVDPVSGVITSPLETLEDFRELWPVEVSVQPALVTPPVVASSNAIVAHQPVAPIRPQRTRIGLGMSFPQATQARLYLEMSHFGYLSGLSPEEMLIQDVRNAHALEDIFGALTQAALQNAQDSLAYLDNGGSLRITLPAAKNMTPANIAGYELIMHTTQSFDMGHGLQVVGEGDVKAISDGSMSISREIITEERIEEDGTRVVSQRAEAPVTFRSLHESVEQLSTGPFRTVAPIVQAAKNISLGSRESSASLEALTLTEKRTGPQIVTIENKKKSSCLGLVKKTTTVVTLSQSSSSSQSAVGADVSAGQNINLLSGASSAFASHGGQFKGGKIVPQGGEASFRAVPLVNRQETVTNSQQKTSSSLFGLVPLGTSRNKSSSSSTVTMTEFNPDRISGRSFNPQSKTVTLEGSQIDVDEVEDDSQELKLLPARGVNSSSLASSSARDSIWRGVENASGSRSVTQDVILPTTLTARSARFGREGQGGSVDAESAVVNIQGRSRIYKSVTQRVATTRTQVLESSQQDGLRPTSLPQLPLFVRDRSSALNAGSQVLEYAVQVGGAINRVLSVANGQMPWWLALLGEFGAISTTDGYSRRSVLTSAEVPNYFNWGHATFYGEALELQGYNTFTTLNGSVSRLAVRPIANSNRVESESFQEQSSFNPFLLSTSFSQLSSRHWESQDSFAASLMRVVQGGDFTVLTNVDADGLSADVSNFSMTVLGDMRMTSPIDVVRSWTQQQSSGFSVSFLSLGMGLATGNLLQIATSVTPMYGYDLREEKHRFVSARSQFGGQGSSLRVNGHLTQVDADIDQHVALYSVGRTMSETPEEHYSNHDYSLLGQAMRFGYAAYGAYSMAMTLKDNLQNIGEPKAAVERVRAQARAQIDEEGYSEHERKALREEVDQALENPRVQQAIRKVEQAKQLLARAREAEAVPAISSEFHEWTYDDLSERALTPEVLSIYDVRQPAPALSTAGKYARQALLAAREGYNTLQGYLEEHPRVREVLATGLDAAGTVLHAAWVASCTTAKGAVGGFIAGGGVGSVPLAVAGASGGYAFALASEEVMGEAFRAGSDYVASWISDFGDTPRERADFYTMSQGGMALVGFAKMKGRGPTRGALYSRSRRLPAGLFQEHHIISDKHRDTRNHDLWRLAGMKPTDDINRIYLPTKKGAEVSTTERSIHQGRHLNEVSEYLAEEMNKKQKLGRSLGWTQPQYAEALTDIIMEERIALKSGYRMLNKHHRPWAIPLR